MTEAHGSARYADDAHRYRLDSRIATGGMGEVWRATDTVLGREVAVKLLKHEYADDPLFRSRFGTEARHAASLHHPGVASVYDFGEASTDDGSDVPRPFLVMELVDGEPLSALLRPGEPLDPDAVRDLLGQVADAVAAAHAAGIVHRDIKPANLLVTPRRTVKITDFGIARAADGAGVTHTGQVMGTPQYLSPEQARGNPATTASDVYALGVVAFEMLAGRRPFQADSPVATALAHLHEPVPDLPRSVPDDLAAVVRRALSKEPGDRFRDAAAFAAALRDPATAVLTAPAAPTAATTVVPPAAATQVLGAPVPVDPTPPGATPVAAPAGDRRRRGLLAGLLAAALVLAAVLVAVALATGGDDEDPVDPPSRSAGTVTIDEGDYVGEPVDEVRRALRQARLRVVTEEVTNPGDETAGLVSSVDPSGRLDVGETVTVEFWGEQPVEEPTVEPTTAEPTPTPEEPTEEPTTAEPTPEPTAELPTPSAPTSAPPSPTPSSARVNPTPTPTVGSTP